MPHWRPRMKASPQITSAEPRIKIPACRSASPKKWKTRPLKMSTTTRTENLAMSPKEAIQSLGTLSHVLPISWRSLPCGLRRLRSPPAYDDPRSLDHRDLGMGSEQGLREHVVERK